MKQKVYERIVKGKKEFIFDSEEEFREYLPLEKLYDNWKETPEGSYTRTDDNILYI